MEVPTSLTADTLSLLPFHTHCHTHHTHIIPRPWQVVIVTDPDVYQPLMRPGPNKLKKYCAPYRMFEVFTKPERANILTSPENATWKAVRQAAVASLNMTNLRCARGAKPACQSLGGKVRQARQ